MILKHETTNLMTKKALAESLKKLMGKRALGKITVREIVEDCGVNRKTFYYHFQDINDLVKWMFEEEAIEIVKQYDVLNDFDEVMCFIMDYIESNNHICNCALDALGRDELKRFFQTDFYAIVRKAIEELSKGMRIPEDYKEFLVNFYTEALASLLLDWIRSKADISREKALQYMSITLFGNIMPILEKAEELLMPARMTGTGERNRKEGTKE